MHIILSGPTGHVGTGVLRYCLASPEVTRLSILSRRDFPLPTGEGIGSQESRDHQYPSSLVEKLKGAHGCIWAQGISQSQVAKDEYIRITYDYPLAAAKAFSTLSETDKFNFVYVSGEGADPTEKTWTLFGKIKGRAEVALRALPSTPAYNALRIFNVRPGGVMASPGDERPGMGLPLRFGLTTAGSLLRVFAPSMISPTKALSKVLVDLAIGDGSPLPAGTGIEDDGHLVRCVGVRRLGDAGRWD
ncbi:hypothetical protein B0H16DRAFT_1677653 [Mycena metata]|uniref:NAD(P)-binding domain-containing protein n=1 Tax=Mycena metata TaxID=1033252 RepID=A0AAD7HMP8_9AGAR|nr:hypothetical protein B0H16DRAFT_1677653 [Mycena metata]